MAYELFLLSVPAGADLEETGEALLVRLTRGHERTRLSSAGRVRASNLADRLTAAVPGLSRTETAGSAAGISIEMESQSGLSVALAEHFVRFLIPFAHQGASAAEAFRQLFALASLAAEATGWRAYDPQEGAGALLDEESCDAALEIYLTVMDQIQSTGIAGGGAGAVTA